MSSSTSSSSYLLVCSWPLLRQMTSHCYISFNMGSATAMGQKQKGNYPCGSWTRVGSNPRRAKPNIDFLLNC